MLAQRFRLSRRDFILARAAGRSFRQPHFSAIVSPNQAGFNRYSVITSTKLSKKATTRNRLRRLIYSCFSTSSPTLGSDIIIFPQPSVLNLSRAQINSCFHSFISKTLSQT